MLNGWAESVNVLSKQVTCFLFFVFPVLSLAQNPDFSKVEVFFYTTNDTIIVSTGNQKSMQFFVKGLNKDEDAAMFVSVFKAYKGIVEMSVSKIFTDNITRQVTITCKPGYSMNNVILVLNQVFKIPYVFVNNQKIETTQLKDFY